MADNNSRNSNAQGGAQATSGERGIQIRTVYVKDASFESPQAPKVFTERFTPDFNLNLGSRAAQVGDDLYEVTLSAQVEARHEDKAVYLVEVQQCGLFFLQGFEGEEKDLVLGAYCPAQLYPYARDAINKMIINGGFQSLHLQPVNFDQLHQRQREQQAKVTAEAGGQA